MRRELDARRTDAEIRQLRALVAAYSAPTPPEVLLIGDSAMLWVANNDPDGRSLAQMVRNELPASMRMHALAGPGYNPRIVNVFLEALEQCPGRPRILVLPASILMATTAWSSHPTFSYIREAPELHRIVVEKDRRVRHLPRATRDDWEEWDRLPLPSLFGARRTMGETRMITQTLLEPPKWAPPTTRWQQAVRMRHMMDLYNAEELTPESPGVALLADMGGVVRRLGVQSVAYISPINREVLTTVLKEHAPARVASNAEVIRAAYLDAAGPGHSVVNATFACGSEDFGDPVHLNSVGRLHMAKLIADGIRCGTDKT